MSTDETTDLTEAERDVWRLLDELVTVNRSEVADLLGGLDLDACPPVGSVEAAARAVVAAVRPLIEADTLDRFADHLRALVATESWCEEAADSGMKLAASEAKDEAAALRTTTPEDTK